MIAKKTNTKTTVKKTSTIAKKTSATAKKVTVTAKKTATGAKKTIATAKKLTTAAKKTTAAKTTELSVTGNKKIGTLQREFNKRFPYMRLGIFYSYAREQVAKGESIQQIDESKTLASVRRVDSGGEISISGNKKIKSLEKEFDTVFGLYCQICYTAADGHRYYTSGINDQKTLSAFNEECRLEGCKKDIYR